MKGYKIIHSTLSNTEAEEVLKLRSDRHKRCLGEGATAKVYPFPQSATLAKGWVYRVQKVSFEYPVEGYLEFAKVCVKSKSRHFPRFKLLAVKETAYGPSEIISVIERLEPWTKYHAGAHYYWSEDIESYLNHQSPLPSSSRQIRDKKGYTLASMRHVRSVFTKHTLVVNDLHSENVMARRDGTIVITDPVA